MTAIRATFRPRDGTPSRFILYEDGKVTGTPSLLVQAEACADVIGHAAPAPESTMVPLSNYATDPIAFLALTSVLDHEGEQPQYELDGDIPAVGRPPAD